MNTENDSSPSGGALRVLGAAIFFGLNGLALRAYFLHTQNPPSLENVAFWGIAGATLLASFFYLVHPGSRMRVVASIHREGRVILVVSVLSALGAFFWFLALQKTGAGSVSFLAKSQVIHGSILGVLFLRERFNLIEAMGLAIALLGVFFIARFPEDVPLDAALYVLSSAFIYAVQSLVVKRFAPSLHGKEFSYLRAMGMSLLYGVGFGLAGRLEWIGFYHVAVLSVIAVLGLVIGRAMYFSAHKHLPISRISTGMLIEPVFVIGVSSLLLEESFGIAKLSGGVMILSGVYLTVHSNIRNRKN